MEKTFQTGSFSFRLRFPEELVLPADMEKFAVEKESADYTYTITIVDIFTKYSVIFWKRFSKAE